MPFVFDLSSAAPSLNPAVAERAESAYECEAEGGHAAKRMIVVDMSLPSSEQRLWAFDLSDASHPTVIVRAKVAHGLGSDRKAEGIAREFGNTVDSGKTSLGLYRVAERFSNAEGRPAFSLDGLDPGFNDLARERHVVFHPSTYVHEQWGTPGRSLGCPAVDPVVFEKLEKKGIEGALFWIDGPAAGLEKAPSLSCGARIAAKPSEALCAAPTWYERGGLSPWLQWQAS